MTEPNPPTEPLTLAQIEQTVKNTMIGQQTEFLELAARNALKQVQDEFTKNATTLFDRIDAQVERSRADDAHDWKNDINKSNFNALQQVEKMWERSERFADVLQVPEDQKQLKDQLIDFMKEGKKLTRDRLKVIRFADRDGWSAALKYVADNIAETEKEEKRMKKGKKEAREEAQSRRSSRKDYRERSPESSRRSSRSSSVRRGSYERGSSSKGRKYEAKCFHCGIPGHREKYCYRKYSKN